MDVTEAISEARLHMGLGDELRVSLSTAINDTETTLDLSDTSSYVEGSILDFGIEAMYVLNVTSTGAEVERAFDGTASSHGAGKVAIVDPPVTRAYLFRDIRDELKRMEGDGLFQVKTASATYDPQEDGIDISSITDLLSVYSISWTRSGRTRTLNKVYKRGDILRLHETPPTGSNDITVTYRAGLPTPAGYNDTVSIDSNLEDIPPLGAAAHAMRRGLTRRVSMTAQPQPRRAEEVPPENIMQAAQFLRARRDERVSQEMMNLRRQWPMRWV